MHCQQLTTVRNGDIIAFVTGHNYITKTLHSLDILSFLEVVRHATNVKAFLVSITITFTSYIVTNLNYYI